jgi:hypothetical protein
MQNEYNVETTLEMLLIVCGSLDNWRLGSVEKSPDVC